jgi:hypothetical protein
MWPSIVLLTDEVLLTDAFDDCEQVVVSDGGNAEDIVSPLNWVVVMGAEEGNETLTCVAVDWDLEGFPVELLRDREVLVVWVFVFFLREVVFALVCDSLVVALLSIFFFLVSIFLDSASESLDSVSSESDVDDSIFSYCKSRSKR